MTWTFPKGKAEKRQALLDAVESIRETLVAGADEAEATAMLSQATVEALYQSGLVGLKLPQALGGAEVDPETYLEVIEALSAIDASAGWCTIIWATGMAWLGAFLPNEAVQEIFPGGQAPIVSGAIIPIGKAVMVDGGYRLTGRWSFGSGIWHSQWVLGGARAWNNGTEEPGHLILAFPTRDAQIHDNWQVMGLKGTGSCDYSVSDLFVPRQFTWDLVSTPQKRGGPLYRLGRPGFVTIDHAAFALGVARQALDTILETARSNRRGYSASILANRGAFQRDLGACDLRLRAARALVIEVLREAWQVTCAGRIPDPPLQAQLRSSATYATEVASEVCAMAFRYTGGRALYLSNTLQRCFRDINAASQHFMVSESAYENHGQFLLGFPDANPMG